MDDFIRRSTAIYMLEQNCKKCVYPSDAIKITIDAFRVLSENDVVSWQWLKQYADGKRVNFASDFVAEAERAYKEEHHE